MDETDLPTQCTQARQDAWLPQADVDEGRTGGHSVASCEGTPAPVSVTGESPDVRRRVRLRSIRSRHTYAELRRPSGRGRQGPVTVSYLERLDWERSEVAYAVNRNVGSAVQRNLLRRRMRAILAEHADELPTGAYLVRSGPGGPSLDFHELKVAMSQALDKATSRGTFRVGSTPGTAPGGGA